MTDADRPSWSRPAFERNNTLATVHGAHSARRVLPLAAEIAQDAQSAPWWPSWLADGSYGPEIEAWAVSEAIVRLLREHVSGMDLLSAITEQEDVDEQETPVGAGKRRMTTARRTAAALRELHNAENRAARLRSRLGLEPSARARLSRDLGAAAASANLAVLHEQGDELVARARARGLLGPRSTEESA